MTSDHGRAAIDPVGGRDDDRLPLRILVPLQDFSGGGTERIAIELAGIWAGLGHAVTIFSGVGDGELRAMVPPGVRVLAADPAIPRALTSRRRLALLIVERSRADAFDVVFIPGNSSLIMARYLDRLTPRPAIVAKVSNPIEVTRRSIPIGRSITRFLLSPIDAFAPMNRGLQASVTAVAGGRLVRAIEDPLLIPLRREAATGVADAVACIGRLVPQKDFALALRTLVELRRSRPATLDVYGDGPERAALTRLAERLAVAPFVHFHGRQDTVVPVLDRAAALLVTSRFEGGPAVAVEALARGVPIVATRCSFLLDDLLADPRAGALVARRDPVALAAALDRVLDAPRPDPERLPVLARFEPQRAARRYLDLFRDAIGARPANPAG